MRSLKIVTVPINAPTRDVIEINLQGAKNSMLNNICLPLLTPEECTFDNVPNITDIRANLEFMCSLGAEVRWNTSSKLSIKCANLKNAEYKPEQSLETTGSKFFIPILTNRFGEFTTGVSRGCQIGDRVFEKYADSLKPFGISYRRENEIYHFFQEGNAQATVRLPFPSFGLTVNAILASVSQRNQQIELENCCLEPEIDNTIDILRAMGADIVKEDRRIRITTSNRSFCGGNFRNLSDRNAAVTYIVAALLTSSNMLISNFDNIKMDAFYCFLDQIGAKYHVGESSILIYSSPLSLPESMPVIRAFLYPDFHSDWQPLISPLLVLLNGETIVIEELFQNRLSHWLELEKMGAKYEVLCGVSHRFADSDFTHAVRVLGGQKLIGAKVQANDLRSAACLVLAGLVASGVTEIANISQLDRGYENLLPDLTKFGCSFEEI